MMRRMAALVVMVSAMVAGAEDKKIDNAKLVGQWKVTKSETDAPPGTSIEFTKDGKLILRIGGGGKELVLEGKYVVKGDSLELTMAFGKDEQTETMKVVELTDTKLVTSDKKGKKDEFEKVKAKK